MRNPSGGSDWHCLPAGELRFSPSMRMNPSLGRLAAGLLGVLILGGCTAPQPVEGGREPSYSRVVVTDFRGRRIAEYVAEGKVRKTEEGTAFRAMQRQVFSPQPLLIRYPLGRPVTVKAPNLLIVPAPKPEWLRTLDRQ